jgi:hypothetical protein
MCKPSQAGVVMLRFHISRPRSCLVTSSSVHDETIMTNMTNLIHPGEPSLSPTASHHCLHGPRSPLAALVAQYCEACFTCMVQALQHVGSMQFATDRMATPPNNFTSSPGKVSMQGSLNILYVRLLQNASSQYYISQQPRTIYRTSLAGCSCSMFRLDLPSTSQS